jgi:hypothetical protein
LMSASSRSTMDGARIPATPAFSITCEGYRVPGIGIDERGPGASCAHVQPTSSAIAPYALRSCRLRAWCSGAKRGIARGMSRGSSSAAGSRSARQRNPRVQGAERDAQLAAGVEHRDLGVACRTRRGAWSLTFGPDGRRLAAAGRDGTTRVWDLTSGREITTFTRHTARLLQCRSAETGVSSQPEEPKVWLGSGSRRPGGSYTLSQSVPTFAAARSVRT